MKIINKIYLISFFYLFSIKISFAGNDTIENPLGPNANLNKFVLGIIDVCIQLGAVLAGLAIMYGGFLYVTAMGDEEKLGKAQKTLTWSLVGTAILLGAKVLAVAIQGTIEALS